MNARFSLPVLILVVFLAMVMGGYFLFRYNVSSQESAKEQSIGEQIRTGAIERPPLATSSTIKALAKTKGFNALVSYTDVGFEPSHLTIKSGDTVRFTNNSSGQIQISANSTLSPTLMSQSFWEFTFATKGEWQLTNLLDTGKIGEVQVR